MVLSSSKAMSGLSTILCILKFGSHILIPTLTRLKHPQVISHPNGIMQGSEALCIFQVHPYVTGIPQKGSGGRK